MSLLAERHDEIRSNVGQKWLLCAAKKPTLCSNAAGFSRPSVMIPGIGTAISLAAIGGDTCDLELVNCRMNGFDVS